MSGFVGVWLLWRISDEVVLLSVCESQSEKVARIAEFPMNIGAENNNHQLTMRCLLNEHPWRSTLAFNRSAFGRLKRAQPYKISSNELISKEESCYH